MVCFGAYFVESHSKSTCIICQFSLGWGQHHDRLASKVQLLRLVMFSCICLQHFAHVFKSYISFGFFSEYPIGIFFKCRQLLGVKISNHFQKIKKAYDHVVMSSNWGIPMCLQHFGSFFFRVASVLVFFPKNSNKRCFPMQVATRGQNFKEFLKNQKKLWPCDQIGVF